MSRIADPWTGVHKAIWDSKNHEVEGFLRYVKGFDPNKKEKQVTPLFLAAQLGNYDVVQMLLDHGADPDSLNTKDNDQTALYAACVGGTAAHVASAERLLNTKKVDVNFRYFGGTPLHLACAEDKFALAVLLIKHGADVEARDRAGLLPLYICAKHGNQCVEPVLLAGARTDAVCNGEMALHVALRHRHLMATKLLLKYGAPVNSAAMLLVTLGKGKRPSPDEGEEPVPLRDGDAPLHIALRSRNDIIFRTVLEAGADCNVQNTAGETVLHDACREGNMWAARRLLLRGADPSMRDRNGVSPLMVACAGGKREMVELLLVCGADVDAVDGSLKTALHHAAAVGNVDICKVLLAANADPYALDVDGNRAVLKDASLEELAVSCRPLASFIGNSLFSDGTVSVSKASPGTPVHLVVLAARAPLLTAAVAEGSGSVTITLDRFDSDVGADEVTQLLRFIYADVVTTRDADALKKLQKLAGAVGLPRLESVCRVLRNESDVKIAKSTYASDFSCFAGSNKYCDLVLRASDGDLSAHKVLCAALSSSIGAAIGTAAQTEPGTAEGVHEVDNSDDKSKQTIVAVNYPQSALTIAVCGECYSPGYCAPSDAALSVDRAFAAINACVTLGLRRTLVHLMWRIERLVFTSPEELVPLSLALTQSKSVLDPLKAAVLEHICEMFLTLRTSATYSQSAPLEQDRLLRAWERWQAGNPRGFEIMVVSDPNAGKPAGEPSLNAPCPCGSKKKYKKCCGAKKE